MKTIPYHIGLAIRAGIGYGFVLWAGGIAFLYFALDLIRAGNAKHALLYLGIGVATGLGGTLLSFNAGRRARRIENTRFETGTP